jgi:hypothetical protein
MRRYGIIPGILLILSIIDFALAVPVLLVPEKRQAGIDVMHIPKDVISVLGKRGDDELEKLAAQYFETWGKPVDSSDAHASSSSAPAVPDHESTNAVQAPGPNPAASTASPGLLMEPSSPSSVQGASGDSLPEDQWSEKGKDGSVATWPPGSSNYDSYDSDKGFSHDGSDQDWWDQWAEPRPNPNPTPSTNADPDFDWEHWMNLVNSPEPGRPKEIDLPPEQPSNPNLPSPELNSDRKLMALSPPYPLSSVGFATGFDRDPPAFPGFPGIDRLPPITFDKDRFVYPSSSDSDSDPGDPVFDYEVLPPLSEPEYEVIPGPPPSPSANHEPELHSDRPSSSGAANPEPELHLDQPSSSGAADPEPELHLDQPSSSGANLPDADSAADSQPPDLLSSIYAAKGKAKVSRRVSGISRDVENAAQKELQSAGRSLDPGSELLSR